MATTKGDEVPAGRTLTRKGKRTHGSKAKNRKPTTSALGESMGRKGVRQGRKGRGTHKRGGKR